MSRYEMSDGMVVDTAKAIDFWAEATEFDGSNHISCATGSQWDHEAMHKTRRGRYYLERYSQRDGCRDSAEWISNEEAARWLLKMEHDLPDDLAEAADSVSADAGEPRNRLYRVIVQTTGSVQPMGTDWRRVVAYCGDDRQEARRIYHETEPTDSGAAFGNPARETVMETIDDAGTDSFADDGVDHD